MIKALKALNLIMFILCVLKTVVVLPKDGCIEAWAKDMTCL